MPRPCPGRINSSRICSCQFFSDPYDILAKQQTQQQLYANKHYTGQQNCVVNQKVNYVFANNKTHAPNMRGSSSAWVYQFFSRRACYLKALIRK